MREFSDHYEEEYLYLADLTDTAALISWGKFFFASTMELVPDRRCTSWTVSTAVTRRSAPTASRTARRRRSDAVGGRGPDGARRRRHVRLGHGADTRHGIHLPGHRRSGRRAACLGGRPSVDYDATIKELVETTRTYACRFRTFPALDTRTRDLCGHRRHRYR